MAEDKLQTEIAKEEITLGYALFAFNDGHITEGEMDLYRDNSLDTNLAKRREVVE